MIALDLAGVAVSAGAACSSGKVSASHVLAAMGLGPLAGQAIRVSLPWNATPEDVEAFAAAYPAWLPGCVRRWRRTRPEPTSARMADARSAEPRRSISTTRPPPGATRGCSPPCCPGSARNTAIRTAPSMPWASAPRRRWRRRAREVAALIGADAKEIVFTSGATESTNIAIKGAARHALRMGDPRRRVVTVATEHKCTLACVDDLADEGFEPVFLPVRPDGLLDPDALRDALAVPTLLVSVMAVNNEIGVVQDIPALAAIATRRGRCSTPTPRRPPARSRSTRRAGGSTCSRSAATRSTARRAWARCTCAGGRGSASRRCSPAAVRSGGCGRARCPRR